MTKISGHALFHNLLTRVDITVDTAAKRNEIMMYRRRWGMVVAVYDDGLATGLWELRKGHSSDDKNDNGNWVRSAMDNWYDVSVPYNTEVALLDLTEIVTGDISSFYVCVTALFGVKHEAPAKKVSLVATRISEFGVHEDYGGSVHGSHVKTQHTGVYAKYGSAWANTPTVLPVKVDDIKVMVSGTDIVAFHKFDKGENIEPTLSCRYRVDLQTLTFE